MTDYITVARPYAKAAFMYAKEKDALIQWSEFLACLAEINKDSDAEVFITRPNFSMQDKQSFIEKITSSLLKRGLDSHESNFLSAILESRRYEALPAIKRQYDEMMLLDNETVEADFISAFNVTDSEYEMVFKALEKHFNKKVKLNVSVDPKLIGGGIIKSGDWVMDNSVKGRLESMASFLVQAV